MKTARVLVVLAVVAMAGDARGSDARARTGRFESYRKIVAQTCAMVRDRQACRLAERHGLRILNVTWEDTGRFKNSAVGPNISDMTLQVQLMDPRTEKFSLYCMPVIRFPNFSDKTGDISPERFLVMVGNERGRPLRRISLRDLLGDLRAYLSVPRSWKGSRKSLLAKRDTRVLVSAQACFLPIARGGGATFNPVLFNYQSYSGDPAVLAILASREGTSVTVIDNKRDGFQAGRTWGQRLFFNANGQRASFTGKRISDYLATKTPPDGGGRPDAAGQKGLNMVLLIQVPLKQKNPRRFLEGAYISSGAVLKSAPGRRMRKSDVEAAVIGHGKVEGPFTEIDNLSIERDPKYPIRVTVQFYKATSNGVVSADDMSDIAAQIARVYKEADYVGSLVTEGDTGRTTEHDGPKVEPPGWWNDFWKRHQKNTGMTPRETLKMLRKIYGPNYIPRSEAELRLEIRKLQEIKSRS